jgi:hypothetical protein
VISGIPFGAVVTRVSYCPIARKVRYGACGWVLRQFHRTQPGICCWRPTSAPLDSASTSSGTEIDTSKVDLSFGWLLLGYHHGAICGSLTASAPVGVRVQPG